MARYVLVHGGGHGGWCFDFVAERLRLAGHEVHAPTLSGIAERAPVLTPDTGLETHVREIATLLEAEDLRNVVLAGHSYGGMVITGAADRMPGRIGHLVYLDAAIPCQGEALVDVSPGLQALRPHNRVQSGVELCLWPDSPVTALYGLAGCVHEDWARSRLTPHPWRCFTDRLHLADPAAVAALPRTIVNCTGTLAVRPAELRHRWTRRACGKSIPATT